MLDNETAEGVSWVFDMDRRSQWAAQGLGQWTIARQWIEAGFTAPEAGLWWTHEFTAPEAALWRDACRNPSDADVWIAAGWDDATQTKAWYELGWLNGAVGAREWYAAGFSAADAHIWQRENFTAEDAAEWVRNRFGWRDARRWRQASFSPTKAALWAERGYDAPDAFVEVDEDGLPVPKAVS